MTENNQTWDWNQQNLNKKNNIKNQWNKEFSLWENPQDRQTLIHTNQGRDRISTLTKSEMKMENH